MNHSLRAPAATRLYASGIDEQLVMEKTGHRSTEGVRSYKRTSSEQHQYISNVLSNPKQPCSELSSVLSSKPADFGLTPSITASQHILSQTINICA